MTLIFAGEKNATETQTLNLQSWGKISFHRAVAVPLYMELSDLSLLYNSYSVMKSTDMSTFLLTDLRHMNESAVTQVKMKSHLWR